MKVFIRVKVVTSMHVDQELFSKDWTCSVAAHHLIWWKTPVSLQQHVFSFRCLSCLICFAVRILTGPSADICLLNTAGWSRSGLCKWADMNQIIISLICRVPVPSAAKDVTLLNYCPPHVLCLPANKFSLHSSSVPISHLSWLDEIFRLIRTTCAGPLFMCVFDNYTSVEAPK